LKIIRVFPRRTNATPIDDLAYVGLPSMFSEADAVHISVSWTWDLPMAEWLEKQWRNVAPTSIGGPATGMRGDAFAPGMYLREGYTITSRGCPNKCWFCSVPKREGAVREYPIQDGWNILDDNILACSEPHIRAVFAMLKRQKRKPEFTGGLEAARLKPWIATELKALKCKQLFFAYDTPSDLEPLIEAGKMMLGAGFTTASHALRCYVLCGWRGDTFDKADLRMRQAQRAGFMPMAMVMRDERGVKAPGWQTFQKQWARPAIISAKSYEPKKEEG
jgi:hypothetical protein